MKKELPERLPIWIEDYIDQHRAALRESRKQADKDGRFQSYDEMFNQVTEDMWHQLTSAYDEWRKSLKFECQNCGAGYQHMTDLEPVNPKHILERVAGGEVFPYGECPNCGSYCHAIDGVTIEEDDLT